MSMDMDVTESDYLTTLLVLVYRVLSTGGGGAGGGGEDSPPNTPASPPQNFCQLNLTKSYNVLAKNLSAIPQLLGPQNCLRVPQNHSQKAQH